MTIWHTHLIWHDPLLWLALFVILAIIYVPVGILAALRGWVTR